MTAPLRKVVQQLRRGLLAGAVEVSDTQLLQAYVAQGDEAAFAALVQRHGPLVWGVCRRVLGNHHDAEDAFQATFLVLLRKAASIGSRDLLAGWLHGVAHNTARKAKAMALKRQHKEKQATIKPAPAHDPDLAAALDAELTRLPERYRFPVVLCDLEGKSRRQAAVELGWPEGTVAGRLARARALLAERLARQGWTVTGAALAGVLAPESAPAGAVAATLKTAGLWAVGAGPVSANVAALAEGAIKTMLLTKLRITIGVLLAASALLAGAGSQGWLYPIQAADISTDEPPPKAEQTPKVLEPAMEEPLKPGEVHIRGQVVDDAGKPVGDALVRVLRAGYDRGPHETRTLADGSFLLRPGGAALRYLTLLATANGGNRQGLYQFVDTDVPLGITATVRIVVAPSRAVRVRVVDAQKRPVAGATVGVFLHTIERLASAQTAANGSIRFQVPAAAKVSNIAAFKAKVGFDYYENFLSWPLRKMEELPEEVALTLAGAQSAQVKVVDAAGAPLSGIELVPWMIQNKGKLSYLNIGGGDGDFGMRTNVAGIAVFDWLPGDLTRPVTFLCGIEAYSLPAPPSYDPAQPNLPLTAQLLRNVRLTGKVTRPDGKPAPGILIQAEGCGNTNHYCRQLARSGADGAYSMIVFPDQRYIVAVTDDNWAAPSYVGVQIKQGEAQNLDFRLERGTLIEGTFSVGRDANPVARQTITLLEKGGAEEVGRGQSLDLVRWASTDEHGHYRIRVARGRFEIFPQGVSQQPQTVDVDKEGAIERSFHLDRLPRGPLSGVVRTADGKPVSGAIVHGQSRTEVTHGPVEARTDAQGRFKAERWRDAMDLYVRHDQRSLAGLVKLGEDDDEVLVTVAPAARITGRMMDADDKPLPGITVYCMLTFGMESTPAIVTIDRNGKQIVQAPRPIHRGTNLIVTTDRDGHFAVGGVLIGSQCKIEVVTGRLRSEKLRELEIKNAESYDLGDLRVPGNGGR